MENTFPNIETERFLLRPFQDDDLAYVFQGLSNPEVTKYYGVSYSCIVDTRRQMNWFKSLEENNTGIWWAICTKFDHAFVGAGGLNDHDPNNRKAETGFWLLPKYWGLGIMQEVMPAIVKYGFENLQINRIEGFVETRNLNCKKALDKLGFVHERTLEDCEKKNGVLISLDIYTKTQI